MNELNIYVKVTFMGKTTYGIVVEDLPCKCTSSCKASLAVVRSLNKEYNFYMSDLIFISKEEYENGCVQQIMES